MPSYDWLKSYALETVITFFGHLAWPISLSSSCKGPILHARKRNFTEIRVLFLIGWFEFSRARSNQSEKNQGFSWSRIRHYYKEFLSRTKSQTKEAGASLHRCSPSQLLSGQPRHSARKNINYLVLNHSG